MAVIGQYIQDSNHELQPVGRGNPIVDAALVEGSTNAIQNGAVYDAVQLLKAATNQIDRWLRFDPSNKRGLIIKANTLLTTKAGKFIFYEEDTKIDLTSYVTQAGKDYFVYLDEDGTITASLTADTTKKKIGRFHTLCVNAGTMTMKAPAAPSSGLAAGGKYLVKPYNSETDPDFYNLYNKTISGVTVQTYYDVVVCEHPLSGFTAGDILPESVFCDSWHPCSLYEDAMVYDKGMNIAVDVYLQSGKGTDTKSEYGAQHTVSRQQGNHQADMLAVGKRLLDDDEFTSMALGSNEATNITGSTDKSTVGGHVDTANRRMISAIGVEEACGYLWQWLRVLSGSNQDNKWETRDGHGTFGYEYWVPYTLLAGGDWYHGVSCGSRSRNSSNVRSYVDGILGGRGASRMASE